LKIHEQLDRVEVDDARAMKALSHALDRARFSRAELKITAGALGLRLICGNAFSQQTEIIVFAV
jgi:hypothetical protein